MKFSIYTRIFLTLSAAFPLVTCSPRPVPPSNLTHKGNNSAGQPLNAVKCPKADIPKKPNSDKENSTVTNVPQLATLGKKWRVASLRRDQSGTSHLVLDNGEIAINGEGKFGVHNVVLDEDLGKRFRREARKSDRGHYRSGDTNLKDDNNSLIIIIALLTCLLILYYYCSCCILVYYLKSKFCFDIDLYKKPEVTCPKPNKSYC